MSDVVPKVIIYTDGACTNNPGPGGWAAVLTYGDHKKEIYGSEKDTTNNRMELVAVIEALENLKYKCEVELYSDSAYIVNAFNNGWIQNWKSNGWVTANKKPVKNKDLWEKLILLNDKFSIAWHKVKGHSTDELNNRCDFLAKKGIKELSNIN